MPDYINVGWRTALTENGDTLQRVSFRELGNATRWPEIAWLNDLRPPYLTGNPTHPGLALGQVLPFGSPIKIPAPSIAVRQGISAAQAFGVDVLLTHGKMTPDATGDVSLAIGVPNLSQALNHRLMNEIGCLNFHPKYGNLAHRLRGQKLEANVALLARKFCEETVLADPRVKSISGGSTLIKGDVIFVGLTVLADDGSILALQAEI